MTITGKDSKLEKEYERIERMIQTCLLISGFLFTYTHYATQSTNIVLVVNQTINQTIALNNLNTSPVILNPS